MSLLDFLSPALTATTQVAGAYQGAKQQAAKDDTAALIQRIQMQRQEKEDALKEALMGAQTRHANAQADAEVNPKPTYDPTRGAMIDARAGTAKPVAGLPDREPPPREASMTPGTPEWKAAKIQEAQIANQFGYHAPPGNVFVTGIGPDGKPTIFAGKNKGDPGLTDTGVGKPVTLGAGNQAARTAGATAPELDASAAIIDKFDDPSLMSQMAKKAGLLGNYINTPEGRQLNQAMTQFVTLVELAKGNKRPTEQMMRRFEQIYQPAPDDDPATRAQKKASRDAARASVHALAGQSGAPVPPPAATPPHVQTIDEMIRAGKSDAEIKAALGHS